MRSGKKKLNNSEHPIKNKRSKAEARSGFRWGEKILDRDEQHRLRREILLRTAAQAFNSTSYHTTTLDDLAKRLNVTKPTLYYYIKDKDDILFECQRMALVLIRDVLQEETDLKSSGVERLSQFLLRYSELMTDDFGICLVRTGLRPLKPESREILRKFAKQIDYSLRNIIEVGIKDGSLRNIEPKLAANAIFGGFNGISNWYKSDGEFSKEEIANTYIDMFLRATKPESTM